jgi:hypothetical protein
MVVTHEELDVLMLKNRAKAQPFAEMHTPKGDVYTFAIIDRCGIALYSHQDAKVFVLEMPEIIKLAKEAGIEKELPLIILPGASGMENAVRNVAQLHGIGEVRRG